MLGIAGFLLVLLLIGFALPRESRFVIEATVDAPAATVFALVNDPRRIRLWSTLYDDDAQYSFAGPARGVGASMSWDSPSSGSGTILIVESTPQQKVELLLNAGEPGEARNWVLLDGSHGTTIIRCGFAHDYGINIIGRYFGLLATGVIRRDYEQSLAGLKNMAESLPSTDFSDLGIEHLQLEAESLAYLPVTTPPDPAAVENALGKAFFEVMTFIEQNGLKASGAPQLVVRDFVGTSRRFDAAVPISGLSDVTPRGERVQIGTSYAGMALKATHYGSYSRLGETHRKMAAYLAATGIVRNGPAWESFVTDPAEVAESDLQTEVYYPVLPP